MRTLLARKKNTHQAALGARIQARRKALTLSQERLAEMVGLTRVHIARIEAGRIDVPFSTLCALAEALGVPLPDLVADE